MMVDEPRYILLNLLQESMSLSCSSGGQPTCCGDGDLLSLASLLLEDRNNSHIVIGANVKL